MIVPSENFICIPSKILYTQEKSPQLDNVTACSIETARSAHVPLKTSYTREKSLHINYFHIQWGCAGTDRSAHVPLKSLTQEKNPYTLFPCSVGLCRDRQECPCALKKAYTREKALHIIVNILCVGSMRFIAIYIYMYAENPYTTEISLHIHNYCSYMYTMGL